MSLAAEEDFRDFVAVRWPDLEAVALLVTLDGDTARRVTRDSLRKVHRRWREALAEGRPGRFAERDLLTTALAASRNREREIRTIASASGASDGDLPAADPELSATRDVVTDALVEALRAATPVERAVLAARSAWGHEVDEVADLLGMPSSTVRDAATRLRTRLDRAHAAARAAQGLPPAEWAVERDVDDALVTLLVVQRDPPDPAALVDVDGTSPRRRSVVLAGAALAATGAAAWWAVARPDAGSESTGTSRRAALGPDDARWDHVADWPARGSLADDAEVLAMVAAEASRGRLLWAEDVLGRRIVVAADDGLPEPPGPLLRVWLGPVGARPRDLVAATGPGQGTWVEDGRDGLAVVLWPFVSATGSPALVVLARPSVGAATYSRTVRPTRWGTVVRTWETLRLARGAGAVRLTGHVGPAARVRCGRYDGPVLGTGRPHLGGGRDPGDFAEEVRWFVAAVTGLSPASLDVQVVRHSAVDPGILAPDATRGPGLDGRVTVVRVTTAGGAVVRSVRVTDDGRSGAGWRDLERAVVLPANTPRDEPFVVRLDEDRSPRLGRFLAVAPGAAHVQLVPTGPTSRASEVVPTRDGVAVVEVPEPGAAATYALARHEGNGHLIGFGVPVRGTDLVDLPPS